MSVVSIGGDNCNEAAVIPVAVGPVGSPNTVTINGDTTPATGPDCGGSGDRRFSIPVRAEGPLQSRRGAP
jgi:hypothetical protein